MGKVLIIFLASLVTTVSASTSSEQACLNYTSNQENLKSAHNYEHCVNAANEGSGSAQYSVGMSYGFAGQREIEEKYYRLAAGNQNVAAYLALGHHLRDENIWESIYWYQRFAQTKTNGYGYAALQLSELFDSLGDEGQANYWLKVCNLSDYQGCN